MARALEIGTAEGLEAVSLRRLAQELGVTPMALYRHVRDKQDLINAMTEAVLDGHRLHRPVPTRDDLDRADAPGDRQLQGADRRASACPSPQHRLQRRRARRAFWKLLEDLLAILLDAGFGRREAIVLIRMLSNLLAGYLLLLQQGAPGCRSTPTSSTCCDGGSRSPS